MVKAKIIVKGLVQMVGFRYYTVRNANSLGIKGYVRNLSSGDVEIFASGKKEDFLKFIQVIKKGPTGAVVNDVIIDYNVEAVEEFTEFDARF
jgi:acylphosphatase